MLYWSPTSHPHATPKAPIMNPAIAIPSVLLASFLLSTANAQVAYASDSTADSLYTIDLTTGIPTLVAAFSANLTRASDLTWISKTQELWAIDYDDGEIGTIDLVTGVFTVRGNTTLVKANKTQGLAWDPATQLFYLSTYVPAEVHTWDPATNTTTLLGASGFPRIAGLEVTADGTLWGIDQGATPSIITIDKSTGAGTLVSTATLTGTTTAVTTWQDIGEAKDGTIYATTSKQDTFYSIDLTTGVATPIGTFTPVGTTGPNWFLNGFEVIDPTPRAGTGCMDSTGKQTEVTLSGSLALTGTFTIDADTGLIPGTGAVTMFGISDKMWLGAPLPFSLTSIGAGAGCMLYQDAMITSGSVLGTGVSISIPNSTNLVGNVLFAQVAVIDGQVGGLGLVFTDYVRLEITK